MRRKANDPEDYVAQLEGEQQEMVNRIRAVIADAVPDVEETIGSGMLDYPGLANLGAQKHYVALYVAPAVLARYRDQFPGTDCGKSCLRFRRASQVDEEVLAEMLKAVRAHRLAAAAGDH